MSKYDKGYHKENLKSLNVYNGEYLFRKLGLYELFEAFKC